MKTNLGQQTGILVLMKNLLLFLICTHLFSSIAFATMVVPEPVVVMKGPFYMGSPIGSSEPLNEAHLGRLADANRVYFKGVSHPSFNFRGIRAAYFLGGQALVFDSEGKVIRERVVHCTRGGYRPPQVFERLSEVEDLDKLQRELRFGDTRIHERMISGGVRRDGSGFSDLDNYLAFSTLGEFKMDGGLRARSEKVVVNITSPKLPCGGDPTLSAHPDRKSINCIDGQAIIVAEAIRQNINLEIRHIANEPFTVFVDDKGGFHKTKLGYDPRIKETPAFILEQCEQEQVYKRVASFTFESRGSRKAVRVLQEFGCGVDPGTGERKYFVFTRQAPEISSVKIFTRSPDPALSEEVKPKEEATRQSLSTKAAPFVPHPPGKTGSE